MVRTCLGIDLGGSKIHVGVVDREGRILASHLAPTDIERGVGSVAESIAVMAERCIAEAGVDVLAAGIGIAGQIDTAAGIVRSSPNLTAWIDVPLAMQLADRLRVPVIATNDLRAIALGEWRFGAGRGVSELVVLFIGTGVGGAVIARDRPLVGAGGYGGELGHMPIVASGRKCHCPGRGCVEAYVSGWALAARAAELLAMHPEHAPAFGADDGMVTAREIASAYAAGDELGEQIVLEAGDHLGAALVAITNAFNPARIILGGGVIDGLPAIGELAESRLRQDAIVVSRDRVRIVRSSLGSAAGVIGAAMWAWDEVTAAK
ncbi:MAG: ROK family protein [Kofleriaceae bacterium]